TADVLAGAASRLRQIVYDDAPVRLDPDRRTADTTQMVSALVAWEARRRTRDVRDDLARAAELRPLVRSIDDTTTHLLVLSTGHHAASSLETSVAAVVRAADRVVATRPDPVPDDEWAEF